MNTDEHGLTRMFAAGTALRAAEWVDDREYKPHLFLRGLYSWSSTHTDAGRRPAFPAALRSIVELRFLCVLIRVNPCSSVLISVAAAQ